jgi:uncharacterized protein YjiS (DUF1127 family)
MVLVLHPAVTAMGIAEKTFKNWRNQRRAQHRLHELSQVDDDDKNSLS